MEREQLTFLVQVKERERESAQCALKPTPSVDVKHEIKLKRNAKVYLK